MAKGKGYSDENVGVGGKRRERVIDSNVTRMAGKAPDGGKPPARARRQKPKPSSFAPSGKKYEGTPSFGAPMQEKGKPRPKK